LPIARCTGDKPTKGQCCASQQNSAEDDAKGQNPNASRTLACQLSPAPDKPPHGLYSAMCRFCCKSPKLPGANFLAVKKSDRRPPIDAAPITLPRSPARLSSRNEVPHIFTRKSRVQPKEILITSAKRLLQQYLPRGDICSAAELGCYSNHLLGDGELHGRNSLAVINLPAAKRRYEFSSSNVDCHATLPWGSCPCNRGTISRLNRPVCDDFTFGGRARRRPRRDRHYCPNGARHNGHSLRSYGALLSARRKRAEGRLPTASALLPWWTV